jgi:hypothetical protein
MLRAITACHALTPSKYASLLRNIYNHPVANIALSMAYNTFAQDVCRTKTFNFLRKFG